MPLTGALALAASLAFAAADPDAQKLIDYVLRTPTAELAPETVSPFMEIADAAVPEKLRARVRAKKEELEALAKIAAGGKKAPLRRIGNEEEPRCEIEEYDEHKIRTLRMAWFVFLEEREVLYLLDKTSCSECEMQTEFTLRVFIKKVPSKEKGKPPRSEKVFMMHAKDPLMALVSAFRGGQESGGTNFFGVGMYPKCR